MASNERIRKYLDAGTVVGQVSRGRAEEIVRELVNAGDIQRSQAQERVDNLVERSRRSRERILELVRHEVATQLDRIDPKSHESLANHVAEILKKSAEAGRSATMGVTTQAGKTATRARDAATKMAPSGIPGVKTSTRPSTSTSSSTRSQAKKAAETKRPAPKKAAAKKAAPKKAAS
jgi:polyhydroxyalkanoate synthesis regulator phasin